MINDVLVPTIEGKRNSIGTRLAIYKVRRLLQRVLRVQQSEPVHNRAVDATVEERAGTTAEEDVRAATRQRHHRITAVQHVQLNLNNPIEVVAP